MCLGNKKSHIFTNRDGIYGPVVAAARRAIENNDLRFVLLWIPESSEAEIRKPFQNTLAVRKLGPQAKEFADTYFFETLVPIHQAGEGAPYTGIKPTGRDLGPAIARMWGLIHAYVYKNLLRTNY
jgi:hypothetical protein